MANIINAAPMVIDQGIEDLSTRVLPRLREDLPQHLPKFYLFARKGVAGPQLVVGNERNTIFGQETFDPLGKYANHATIFANLVNEQGNSAMIERIIPTDAGPEANITLYIELTPAKVDTYLRDNLGVPIKNAFGQISPGSLADGYNVGFSTSSSTTKDQLSGIDSQGKAIPGVGFGKKFKEQYPSLDKQGAPILDDNGNPVLTTKYPIMEFKVNSQGEWGNLCGFRIWPVDENSVPTMPNKLMNSQLAYPFFVSLTRKPDSLSSPQITETLFNEKRVMITFKRDTTDPLTTAKLYLGDVLIDAYQNIKDPRYPRVYGDFSDLYVYDNYVDEVVTALYTAELPYFSKVDSNDFRYDSQAVYDVNIQKYLINFLGLSYSNGIPYFACRSTGSLAPTYRTDFIAKGGSDGTMTDEIHDLAVRNKMNDYADPRNIVHDIAINVESIMYDSGYTVLTKKALCKFIAVRKDTFIVLSAYDAVSSKGKLIPGDDGISMAQSLKSYLEDFPESDYFGTPVTRGLVMARSGKLRNSIYLKRLPLSAEVAIKAAKYMGAGNGIWKNGKGFDGAPGSIIERMYDVDVTWVNAAARNLFWDNGINYVLNYDRKSLFFPALKTIYQDDTSVLNSFFTAMACCELNKVAHAAWREFSGVAHMTNAQLARAVNDFIVHHTQGRFDNRFVIKPDAFFTDMDILRGFSWTLPIKLYSNSLKSVMATSVQAFRMEDLTTGA